MGFILFRDTTTPFECPHTPLLVLSVLLQFGQPFAYMSEKNNLIFICLGVVGAASLAALIMSAYALSRPATTPSTISAQQGTFSTITVSNGTFQYISSPTITSLAAQVNASCTWTTRVVSSGQCLMTTEMDSFNCGNYTRVWYPYFVTESSCGSSGPTFIKFAVDLSSNARSTYTGVPYYTVCGPTVCQNKTCLFAGAGFMNFTSPFPVYAPQTMYILGGTNGSLVTSSRTWDMRNSGAILFTTAFIPVIGWAPPSGQNAQMFNGFTFGFQGKFEAILATLA